MAIQILQLSSLEKVFLDYEGQEDTITAASVLKGERFSYQLAYRSTGERARLSVAIDSVRRVGNVPSELPLYPEMSDADYLRREPGLYPAPLYEDSNDEVIAAVGSWHSIWITAEIPVDCRSGSYSIQIRFFGEDDLAGNTFEEEKRMNLRVIPAVLPEQKLRYTQWFHADCIASYYGLETFSEEHWQRIGVFM